jgi:hypothetical protein
LAGAAIAERRRVAKVVAIRWFASEPLFAGFPDGTGKAEKSDTIVGGEGGAELKVSKGGYSQHFNLGTVDWMNQDTVNGSGGDTTLQEEVGGGLGMPTTLRTWGARKSVAGGGRANGWGARNGPTWRHDCEDGERGAEAVLRHCEWHRARISAWRLASTGIVFALKAAGQAVNHEQQWLGIGVCKKGMEGAIQGVMFRALVGKEEELSHSPRRWTESRIDAASARFG